MSSSICGLRLARGGSSSGCVTLSEAHLRRDQGLHVYPSISSKIYSFRCFDSFCNATQPALLRGNSNCFQYHLTKLSIPLD